MGLLRKKKQSPPARRRAGSTSTSSDTTLAVADQRAFRRNRTLTGSLASHVESASEANAELRSKRVQTHDLHAHRRHLSLYLFGSLCVIVVLGWVIYQSIAVPQITADTKVVVDQQLYSKKIQDYLIANPFQRLRVTVDTVSLTSYLQMNGFPEVESVSSDVVRTGFGASSFAVTFRTPAVVWKTGTTKLYVDDEGNAFTRNYYDDPTVEVVDQTGIQAKDNQVLASQNFLGTIGRVIGKMKAQGYTVTRVVLPADTTHQLLVSIEGVGFPIKFSVDRSVGEQAEDVARAIKYLQGKGITPEYIDVRVEGKAFYK